MLKNIINDENGQGMVEYGLILGLIAVAAIAVIALIGPKISGIFSKANTELSKVPSESPAA